MQIYNLQSEELRELIGIIKRRDAEIARLNQPQLQLRDALTKVRAREWAELRNSIDPAKAEAIRAKYKHEIEELVEKIKARESEMARLTAKMHADLAALDRARIDESAKLERPEVKIARLLAEERAELHKLLDPDKVESIRAEYSRKLAELEKKVLDLAQAKRRALEECEAGKAKIEAELAASLYKLDPPDDRMGSKLALVKAQWEVAMENASTADQRKEVQAIYDATVKALKEQANELRENKKFDRRLVKDRIAEVQAACQAKLAKLDPLADSLKDQIARLLQEEKDQIAKLADPRKVKEIHDRFDGQIKRLEQKIYSHDEETKRAYKLEADKKKIIDAWRAELKKLDSPDQLERKLYLLRERVELNQAFDPAKERAIREKFAGEISDLQKNLGKGHQEKAQMLLQISLDLQKTIDKFNRQLAPLEKRLADLIAQLSKTGATGPFSPR
jgi:chromosome segregation ATPase